MFSRVLVKSLINPTSKATGLKAETLNAFFPKLLFSICVFITLTIICNKLKNFTIFLKLRKVKKF